jgi:hypothetical protein
LMATCAPSVARALVFAMNSHLGQDAAGPAAREISLSS